MAIADYQIYGEKVFRLKPDKLNRRAREIHGLQGFWQTDDEDHFTLGDAPPDYPNMRIVEIDSDLEIEDNAYEQRIMCEGIIGDASFLELDKSEATPEEGWDEIPLTVFTRFPDDARWARGARLQDDDLTGVSGTASTDKLGKTAHGLVTGQLFSIAFASGFTGLTTAHEYFAIKIDDDNIKVATTKANAIAGTTIDITVDGTDATITPFPVGYEFMFIMDRVKHVHRAKDYYTLDLSLKGLRGDKPGKRRMNTAGQAVSSHVTGLLYLTGTNWVGYPPVDSGTSSVLSVSDADVEYDIPNGTVSDTLITTTEPPMNLIGQFWTPDNAPTLSGGFTIFGDAYTYHVPFGMKCSGIQTEQLAGRSVWLVTVTWASQRAQSPKEPPPAA